MKNHTYTVYDFSHYNAPSLVVTDTRRLTLVDIRDHIEKHNPGVYQMSIENSNGAWLGLWSDTIGGDIATQSLTTGQLEDLRSIRVQPAILVD